MSNWNDLSRDRLITEYRKYPCLWSNKSEDSKNAEKRRECLNMIKAELNRYEEKPFTQEEVRTQFKNLRDMYRRKRKKLQIQQEINPAAEIDEPGWVYFSRLKFLDDIADFGPSVHGHLLSEYVKRTNFSPNESPPPPAKKKGKIMPNRPPDDASLPTPLEENCAIPGPSQQSTTNSSMEEDNASPESVGSSPKVAIEDAEEGGRREEKAPMKEEAEEEESMEDGGGGGGMVEWDEEQKRGGQPSAMNGDQPTGQIAQTQNSAKQQKEATNGPPHQWPPSLGVERKGPAAIEELLRMEDEFACFGRFVAMTLKKISARSPVGALEARKEISDCLYRAELGSLPR